VGNCFDVSVGPLEQSFDLASPFAVFDNNVFAHYQQVIDLAKSGASEMTFVTPVLVLMGQAHQVARFPFALDGLTRYNEIRLTIVITMEVIMNKAITIGLLGLILFFGLQHNKQDKTVEEMVDYLSFTGTITEVRDGAVLVQEETNEENFMVFNISEQVLLLEDATQNTVGSDSFAVGQKITAYYLENTPMALSFPAIMTPDVLLLHSGEDVGFVHVATFDETLTSSDGMLKIVLGSGMTLVDAQGKQVTNLAYETLVVFYTTSTRSIPAQTTPKKIIVL
jgi:hypothetical protein